MLPPKTKLIAKLSIIAPAVASIDVLPAFSRLALVTGSMYSKAFNFPI
jgi:hypothetical protein